MLSCTEKPEKPSLQRYFIRRWKSNSLICVCNVNENFESYLPSVCKMSISLPRLPSLTFTVSVSSPPSKFQAKISSADISFALSQSPGSALKWLAWSLESLNFWSIYIKYSHSCQEAVGLRPFDETASREVCFVSEIKFGAERFGITVYLIPSCGFPGGQTTRKAQFPSAKPTLT